MIILKILFGLFGLSIVVVVHEAGHLIAARLSGIKVEAFSIGWGKIIYTKMWKGTEFRLSLFPLGGYCKMQGEQAMIQAWESKSKTIESAHGDMYGASWWKRIIVSISGPVMNLIFAAVIFFSVSLIGYNIYFYPSQIVLASEYTDRTDYPADSAGLQSGDYVIAVNHKDIERFDQLQEAIILHPDEDITLTILRNGLEKTISVRPELNKDSGAGTLGIYPWIDPVVRSLSEDSEFHSFGLLGGDRITSVNGVEVHHALEISSLLGNEGIKSISVIRNGFEKNLLLDQSKVIENAGIQFDYLTMRTESGQIMKSFSESSSETYSTVKNSLKGLTLLFKGINLQSAVSGPLRITYMTGDLAFSGFSHGISEGFLSFFRFLALINIALFIMNLLPIPVLDGGQILLFLIEGLTRRKPNPAVLYRYQMIGTVLVFALILFATMNDILFFSRK
ncbi:RIP metalloprotease RseP [Oceanispirochaeta sp.]|jgi:regulator of sigma E protease|uniref:RIP metalloprotease RseP n=1 Tax=Oceanispirochaeta sp. TaxID=2035350 RepID=UPI002636755C|nr:RIP metalloprotease RseP [Oceanispirochaeta sp.]MDA3956633.1 RIP metalloprotease RseP [Oceanispirochaeta sp.]